MGNVMVDNKPIEDSPFTFNVKIPNKTANPNKSYAKYLLSPDLQPTADYSLAVFAVNSDGKPETNSNCKVEMKGPDGSVNIRVEESDNGNFKVRYRPELLTPGDYSMNVFLDNQPIKNIPMYSVKSSIESKNFCSSIPVNQSGVPIKFIGFEGDPPQPDECAKILNALRSIVRHNDFIQFEYASESSKSADFSVTMFCPRLSSLVPDEIEVLRWCVAPCVVQQ